MTVRYFANDKEITEEQALMPNGVVRSGVTIRTALQFADSRLKRKQLRDPQGRESGSEEYQYEDDPDRDQNTDDGIRLTDGAGRDGLALHRPGFRQLLNDDAGRDAKEQAYAAADHQLRNAWRDADPLAGSTGAGEREFTGSEEGDTCMVTGQEYPLNYGDQGTMQLFKGRLVCTPNKPRGDSAADRRAALVDAYERADQAARDAWKGTKQIDEVTVINTSHRSVADARRAHAGMMSEIYHAADKNLQERWRTG